MYEDGDTSGLDAHSLGSAAALQVLKGYIGGDAPQTGHSADFQTKMIGMAMSEAAQMFEKTGGTASGDKQDAINGAATTMFKLFVQSKLSGGGSATTTGGGSNLSSLMSLVSTEFNGQVIAENSIGKLPCKVEAEVSTVYKHYSEYGLLK